MAVDLPNLEILLSLIREHRPQRILAFGHPDILVDDAEIERQFGLVGDGGGAHVLFGQLGAELMVVDRRRERGVDQTHDLNHTLPGIFHDVYDMVIDSGTSEHVFNVGHALVNVLKVLRVGGVVYHCNPMAMFNHGYWNFSPVAYHDFYTGNGCEILRLDIQRKGEFTPVQQVERFRMPNDGKVMMVCVARKLAHVDTVRFPMQAKYQRDVLL